MKAINPNIAVNEPARIDLPIVNREAAGRTLANKLRHYAAREDVIVLALPRGGIPVALEVAQSLGVSMDLMLVRKLGTPGQRELAMGAIALGGARVINPDVVGPLRISDESIEQVTEQETRELARRAQVYRGMRPLPEIYQKVVILVDDGVATGATMRVAIHALRQQQPARMVVAVPVAPALTIEQLQRDADEVICLHTPEPFIAIGRWYKDFAQVSDEQVKQLLAKAWS